MRIDRAGKTTTSRIRRRKEPGSGTRGRILAPQRPLPSMTGKAQRTRGDAGIGQRDAGRS